MDWWLILLIFIVIVAIVWWAMSRQTAFSGDGHGEHADGHGGEHDAPQAEAPAKAEAAPAAPAADDLTKIEGIGPKVQGLLNAAGIMTFAQLAEKTPEELDEIMDAAGSIYKAMDEGSWPRQAGLAAAGDWDALKKLQDELVGGR